MNFSQFLHLLIIARSLELLLHQNAVLVAHYGNFSKVSMYFQAICHLAGQAFYFLFDLLTI